MRKETTRPTRREILDKAMQDVKTNDVPPMGSELQGQACNTVQERQELFTLTLEADNVFIEFSGLDRYCISTVQYQLTEFCSSLSIIKSTITITKEEESI